jgi:DNA segregation ATPase FtsK/SpoIIIE, S-DNA-T family
MISNSKKHSNLRVTGNRGAQLSPRFAALLRESWWLLVVAGFVYLALILATYQRSDPGWSFSGTGEALHNRGGVVGAWLADLLLYVFGASAWWWVFAGIVLVVTGYRHLTRDDIERHHVWLAVPGFLLVLLASSALEALRLYRLPIALPGAPGGALGESIGRGLANARDRSGDNEGAPAARGATRTRDRRCGDRGARNVR